MDEENDIIEEVNPGKGNRIKDEIIDWIKVLFFYCVVPLVLFECFFSLANVPTDSMENTLPTGAEAFVVRSFNKDNIERGDIVVFNSDELGILLVKRCIGLPGDTVEFDGTGDVYVNGILLEEDYVSSYSSFEGSFTVPDDCYFFCGDNRKRSYDSRYWKNPYINKNEIMGKVKFVLYPFSKFGIV